MKSCIMSWCKGGALRNSKLCMSCIQVGRRDGPQHNFISRGAPGAHDDEGSGYTVGSLWVNTEENTVYICSAAEMGKSAWARLGAAVPMGKHNEK